MRLLHTWVVGENDAGQRLDRFLSKVAPKLPYAAGQKAIRMGRVKLDGRRARAEARLTVGQHIAYYGAALPEEGGAENQNLVRLGAADAASEAEKDGPVWQMPIVFEDENILIAAKPAGMSVQPDSHGARNTLSVHILRHLRQTGQWDAALEHTFVPGPVHRIDRNTGGLVAAAKNAEAMRILMDKFRNREVEKYYLCILHGSPQPREGTLFHYLLRDADQSRVTVTPTRRGDAKTAQTQYRVLASANGLSLVECKPITGRTHQIRAQWAAEGHPLVGDGKYADNRADRARGCHYQALFAYKMIFSFRTSAGPLDALRDRSFETGTGDIRALYRRLTAD